MFQGIRLGGDASLGFADPVLPSVAGATSADFHFLGYDNLERLNKDLSPAGMLRGGAGFME
jgi:hypothetical protein